MATVSVDADRVVVRLTTAERILGLLPEERSAPLASVRSARVVRPARDAIRGLRAPGTGVPGVAWIGHWRGRGHDLVAVYGDHEGVVVELQGGRFDRFVVSVDDPEAIVAAIEGRSSS